MCELLVELPDVTGRDVIDRSPLTLNTPKAFVLKDGSSREALRALKRHLTRIFQSVCRPALT